MNHVEKLNQALSRAFAEVFGADLLQPKDATLNHVLSFLMAHHGEREDEGLANEIGKFAYHPLKRLFQDELGFQDLAFRTLPSDERAAAGLSRLLDRVLIPADFPLSADSDAPGTVLSAADSVSSDRESSLALRLAVGILQEAYADLSGGKALRFQTENRRTLRLFI